MNDFEKKSVETSVLLKEDSGGLAETVKLSFYQTNKLYIWSFAFGVLIILILGFFAFRPMPKATTKSADIEVVFNSEEAFSSGSDSILRVNVKNKDSQKLVNLELELAYPSGIVYIDSSPKSENLSGSLFKIPDLTSGQNASLIIKIKPTGDINSEKKVLAKLRYKFENFNSSFVKEVFYNIRLKASDIFLEIDGPKEVNSSQIVIYKINYKNNSKNVLKNVRIKAEYPQGFNFGSSEPASSLGGNIWQIGDLQEGGEGEISIHGNYSLSNSGESKKIVVAFQILGEGGEFFTQNETEINTDIISQPLLVELEDLDGRTDGVVAPGDTLNVSVRYKNNSQTSAEGVNILVSLDSKALDFASLQAQNAQIVNNTILWNASGVPELENINPSEGGILNFYIRLKKPAVKDSSKDLAVKIVSKIKSNQFSSFLPGQALEFKISSPVEIQSELRFLSGSLPPKIGTQTKYKAVFKILNSSNDLQNGELTMFLPTSFGNFNQESVTQNERQNVEFDSSTGKLTWKINFTPAHSGKFSPAKTLEFEISVNPSLSDYGNYVNLLRNIKFFAQDSWTKQKVLASFEDLTTASLVGENGYSKGVVVE